MAANNLDFYNMCLEGIGKIKITDGQENNIYAAYYRSSFSSDYAESFSYDFGVNTKTIELSLKSYNSRTGWSSFAYPPLLQIINVFHEDRYLTYPYTVEGNSLNVLTGIKEKFSAYGVVSLTPLELEKHIILESFVKKKIQTNIINDVDKEDKTSAYLRGKVIELADALNKAQSLGTPNRYKVGANVTTSGIL
jgi:hypothetical protein